MEFESTIKKNSWIFFQKYIFIRKIEPFHLRMKDNIIEMTAMAGLTVPHLINPIFHYIFDCLGKRWIRSTSKVVQLGLRKSKRHHWEADARTMSDCLVRILVWWHHWTIFLRKWSRSRRYGQWQALPCHAQRIYVSKNWRGWHGRHLISTGRGHLPKSQRNNRSVLHRFRKSNNRPNLWCQLAASEL